MSVQTLQTLRAQRWRWQPWRAALGVYLALPAHWTVQADDTEALQEAQACFDAWCTAHAGERCELALGAAATLWQVAPMASAGVADLQQAWDQAFAHWAHYLDVDLREPERLAGWHLQEAQGPGSTVLAATPLALTEGLMAVAQAHGVRVDWMGPWWARGLARWLAQAGAAPEADVLLVEPGWTWRARVQPPTARAGTWLRRAPTAWTLLHLGVDGGRALNGAAGRPGTLARLALEAPGATGGQAACVSVDLGVLQGRAPMWGGPCP
ncbi:MAG: hypothetical protein RI907_1988 [Pseudomonadota bacterium]|jgi:hypothetical protein